MTFAELCKTIRNFVSLFLFAWFCFFVIIAGLFIAPYILMTMKKEDDDED